MISVHPLQEANALYFKLYLRNGCINLHVARVFQVLIGEKCILRKGSISFRAGTTVIAVPHVWYYLENMHPRNTWAPLSHQLPFNLHQSVAPLTSIYVIKCISIRQAHRTVIDVPLYINLFCSLRWNNGIATTAPVLGRTCYKFVKKNS